jgi:hypothetical protein
VYTAALNKTELLLTEEQELSAFLKLQWSVGAPLARSDHSSQVCTVLGWAVISCLSEYRCLSARSCVALSCLMMTGAFLTTDVTVNKSERLS